MTQNIQSASISDRGLSEKRPQNEDSFLELPAFGLFVVADGVGGAQAGDVASQMATEVLGEAFAHSRGGDVEDLMRAAIEKANESIYQMSHDLPQLSTMATTIVTLHVTDNIATIGHVGDSRIYRVDPRGNLFRETQDHSVVEEEVRAGRMTPAQAAHHPSKNVISRALGAEQTVEVDMKTIMFEPNTSFLLCSDGVTRHIEDPELRQLLRQTVSPTEICAEIKKICYERGAEDNLTAVIVRAGGVAAENDLDDENTVATARPAVVSNAAFAHPVEDPAEIPTRGLEMPVAAAENFQTPERLVEDQVTAPVAAGIANTNTETAKTETIAPAASTASNYQPVKEVKVFAVEEKSRGTGFGKLIGGLILGLLLGTTIGAVLYYVLSKSMTPSQETPKITEMQSPNIPFTAFEKNRRNVDSDPAKYIATNGTTAADAEDFYLLGRADMLLEKYVEAKNSFVKAEEVLPQSSSADKTMLGNEIAIGLSIVDAAYAKDVLKEERRKTGASAGQVGNTNTATNSNTPANSNTEIKPTNTQVNANN